MKKDYSENQILGNIVFVLLCIIFFILAIFAKTILENVVYTTLFGLTIFLEFVGIYSDFQEIESLKKDRNIVFYTTKRNKQEIDEMICFLKWWVHEDVLIVGKNDTGKKTLIRYINGLIDIPMYVFKSDYDEEAFSVAIKNRVAIVLFMNEFSEERIIKLREFFHKNMRCTCFFISENVDENCFLDVKKIVLKYPSSKVRKSIISSNLKKQIGYDSLEFLIKVTENFSVREVLDFIKELRMYVSDKESELISIEDINQIIDEKKYGKVIKNISDKKRQHVLYHVTGHAVVMMALRHGANSIREVSVISREKRDGFVAKYANGGFNIINSDDLLNEITICLAGPVSERLFMRDISIESQKDLNKAKSLAFDYVTKYGFFDRLYGIACLYNQKGFSSNKMNDEIYIACSAVVKEAMEIATSTLNNNSDFFNEVYSKLDEMGSLDESILNKIYLKYFI